MAALLLVVCVVATLFFTRAIRVEESEYLAQNDAIARSVAASIEAREQGYLNVLRSYAGRFQFRESVKYRDRKKALVHLRQLHQDFPELDRVFLADPAGIVWATEPEMPEVYGQSYAFRDWYQGVSRSWRPYMSEIYQTDLGHTPAVALAMPIHDVDEQVIGIIVSVQRLDVLLECSCRSRSLAAISSLSTARASSSFTAQGPAARAYLTKPLDVRQLLALIDDTLRDGKD